jgi:hypothetical protein
MRHGDELFSEPKHLKFTKNIITQKEYEDVGTAYLKFVIATEQDFEDAQRAVEQYRAANFRGHVYLMPVGGVESVYALNNRNVADLAMKNGLRYSDRLQVPLFKNEWGT